MNLTVVVCVLLALPVIGYIAAEYIKYRLRKWEQNMYNGAPPIKHSHEEMVNMAKSKKEEDMTEEEFDTKYGNFRHEVFRGFTMLGAKPREMLNNVLHYIELYFYHFGENSLKSKKQIHKPIFIIGDFRSGTSVLERIIHHHPKVCAFNFGHMLLWKAPYLWDRLYDFFQYNREKAGHPAAFGRNGKGLYSPHSSNNLLFRTDPWELETVWCSCKRNLGNNRDFKWDTLDDPKKCKDNIGSPDLLDENFSDPKFEKQFKNAIRMLLLAYNGERFINKNPLNGFRVGFLKKMFPDAKFIHISRNPIKTTKSQILMGDTFARFMYMDVKEFRRENMCPKPLSDPTSNKQHWSYMTSGKNQLNEHIGQWWMPRWWPRTYPEHLKINQELKKDKVACANAVGVTQHERVARDAYKRLNMVEGKDVLYIWHEDIIEDATLCMKTVFKFLEIETSDEQILEFLEKQDFPNGQANTKRVSHSNKRNTATFGDETTEVMEILEPVLKRFKERISIKERWGKSTSTKTNTTTVIEEETKESEDISEKESTIGNGIKVGNVVG